MSIPTEIEALAPAILDCDYALNHSGGDPELLVQLCHKFLQELPLRLEHLEWAIRESEYRRAGRALLQLQNCIVVFGVGHASCTAEKLELALRERRYQVAKDQWERLQLQLRYLVPQVQRLILEMVAPAGAVQ